MMPFSIIVAVDEQNGIGSGGKLPWHLKADLRRFKEITVRTTQKGKVNVVIMGRKTWESLPSAFRPLPSRINVVITRNKDFEVPAGVFKAHGLNQAFQMLEQANLHETIESVYVIGGAQVFQEAVHHPGCRKIYLTKIFRSFGCDTFFPSFLGLFEEKTASTRDKEDGITFLFAEYMRKKTASSAAS